MGAYLSQPITKKESTDHEGTNVSCGASSMQGWRIYQEDAHNVIIDFDENKSLFAVYDGHGGSEVAVYTSQHLPEFIKKTAEFKKGNYKQALIDAFMEFDESLIKDEVMAILKTLKKENEGEDSYPATDEDALDDDGDENVSNLYEEATMPLSEVISRYKNPGIQRLKESGDKPMSPRLKAKDKRSSSSEAGCSSSSGSSSSGFGGSGLSNAQCSSSSSPSSSSSKVTENKPSEASSEASPSSSSGNTATESGNTVKSEPSSSVNTSAPEVSSSEKQANGPDSSKPEENGSVKVDGSESVAKNGSGEVGGSESVKEGREGKKENGGGEEAVISSECSEMKPLKKGKAKDKPLLNGDGEVIPDGPADSSALSNGKTAGRTSPRKPAPTLGTANLLESTLEDESSDDDEDFHVDETSSSDGDDDDEVSASHVPGEDEDDDDDDDDEELDDEEDDDDEDDSDDSDFDDEGGEGMSREDIQKRMKEALEHKDVPGMDSGCTAVVVLIVENQAFIANAGDSRAVLCRDGLAVDLSEDHKPEDEKERERIVKAGGEVTPDGRVNGGLNLSRALGDHSYKQTSSLPAAEQMITALPDVTTISLTPSQDQFIVIACDGIWNSLSSQEVVDFVRERVDKLDCGKLEAGGESGGKKLSAICEELFDKCLAPDSLGDGTGCDNMTCVIVHLHGNRDGNHSNATIGHATKRTRDEEEDQPAKKPKVAEAEVANIPESVVSSASV